MKNLLVLIIGLLLFSCSIQKRQHLPGYHITYYKNYKSNSKEINPKQVITVEDDELVTEQITQNEEAISKQSLNSHDVVYSEENELKEERKPIIKTTKEQYVITYNLNSRKSKLLKIKKAKVSTKKDLANDNQQISLFALLSFIFALLSLLLLLAIGFPFFMAVAAIVLSSIAIHRFRTGKDVGRGKGLAIAGLIIGILSLLIFWVIIIVVIFILSTALFW